MFYSGILNQIEVATPSVGSLVAIGIAAALLLCSGFVSASEIAFFSLTPRDMEEVEEERHRSDEKISRLLAHSERLLATILISNNLVNVAIIMLLNFALMQIFHFATYWVEFLLMTVLLTFLLLLFGEVMPKIYSAQHRLGFCRVAAPVYLKTGGSVAANHSYDTTEKEARQRAKQVSLVKRVIDTYYPEAIVSPK